MHLNDAVLEANQGAWNKPPATDVDWSDTHRRGLKDPRMILVIKGWTEVLSEWRPVATFRHPMAVARSLAARDQMPVDEGLSLWLEYNSRLLRILDETAGPVISFDGPLDDYNDQARNVARQLGLRPPRRLSFPEHELRTQAPDNSDLLEPPVREVYEKLRALAV